MFTTLPSSIEHFLGRDKECQRVVELLNDNKLVHITGISGIGKSAVAKETVQYMFKRNLTADGVIYLSLVDCHNFESLIKRLSYTIHSNTVIEGTFVKLLTKHVGIEEDLAQ